MAGFTSSLERLERALMGKLTSDFSSDRNDIRFWTGMACWMFSRGIESLDELERLLRMLKVARVPREATPFQGGEQIRRSLSPSSSARRRFEYRPLSSSSPTPYVCRPNSTWEFQMIRDLVMKMMLAIISIESVADLDAGRDRLGAPAGVGVQPDTALEGLTEKDRWRFFFQI